MIETILLAWCIAICIIVIASFILFVIHDVRVSKRKRDR